MSNELELSDCQVNDRYCVSANDQSKVYDSDVDGEEEWTSLPNSQNILTCSLTQLNSTPSSLVTSGET